MGKQAAGNLFQRNEGLFVERDTRKRRGGKKKERENKGIIIIGGGKYPKLVFIVATPARCYGDRQLSFQGRALGRWCTMGTQEEVSGLGTLGLSLLVPAAAAHLSLIAPPVIYGAQAPSEGAHKQLR